MDNVITPELFLNYLKEIAAAHVGDPEAIHVEADKWLCKVLREWGYGEGVDYFEEMDKWYA